MLCCLQAYSSSLPAAHSSTLDQAYCRNCQACIVTRLCIFDLHFKRLNYLMSKRMRSHRCQGGEHALGGDKDNGTIIDNDVCNVIHTNNKTYSIWQCKSPVSWIHLSKKKRKQPNFLSGMNWWSEEGEIEAYDFMRLDSSMAAKYNRKQAA